MDDSTATVGNRSFFRSFSLRSPTMRLKRSKNCLRLSTRLATNPITRQPPRRIFKLSIFYESICSFNVTNRCSWRIIYWI